jgi:gamma-glutamylcyclotransferase
MSAHLTYFAYGSNLHPTRLGERLPGARLLTLGQLRGHRLRFHKRGRDGSGKCDCHHTGEGQDTVLGVLYRISRTHKATLDRIEGIGYHSVRIRVVAGGTTATAYTYVARPGHVDTQLRPYAWYRDLVVRGAEHHGFPRDYIHMIAATHVIQDPDPLRRALHAALLARIRRQGHPR